MMKSIIFRLLISICVLFYAVIPCFSMQEKEIKTFVSLSPALTEIMYAIGADSELLGVSSECNYPNQVKNKDIIGNVYFINTEKLLKIKPDYILMTEGVYPTSKIIEKTGIKTISFEMNSVNAVYNAILTLGKLSNKNENAENLVKYISNEIEKPKVVRKKKILYLIQTNPYITIGNKSFISDVIKQAGHISVTDDINEFYPSVSSEYLVNKQPDIIVVCFKSDEKMLQKIFPHKKIIYLSKSQNDLFNRPSSRINLSVKFFANF